MTPLHSPARRLSDQPAHERRGGTQVCGSENVSTVPTQALTLLNDEFVLRQARLFADRVEQAAPHDPAKQVDLAYRIALSRPPRAEEAALAADFLKTRSLADFTHVLFNLNEFLYAR